MMVKKKDLGTDLYSVGDSGGQKDLFGGEIFVFTVPKMVQSSLS